MTIAVRLSRLAGVLALAGAIQVFGGVATYAAETNPSVRTVRTALDNNPAVVGSDFRVTTAGSHVVLSGVASTEFEEQQALATVKSVPGVSAVINHTKVDEEAQFTTD
jgi:osmotically-inducible protein OsmY